MRCRVCSLPTPKLPGVTQGTPSVSRSLIPLGIMSECRFSLQLAAPHQADVVPFLAPRRADFHRVLRIPPASVTGAGTFTVARLANLASVMDWNMGITPRKSRDYAHTPSLHPPCNFRCSGRKHTTSRRLAGHRADRLAGPVSALRAEETTCAVLWLAPLRGSAAQALEVTPTRSRERLLPTTSCLPLRSTRQFSGQPISLYHLQ